MRILLHVSLTDIIVLIVIIGCILTVTGIVLVEWIRDTINNFKKKDNTDE